MDYNGYNVYGGYQQPFNGSRYQMPMQPVQQMQPQMMQSQAAAPANDDSRIWIQGRGAAEAYLVAPNGFITLWDSTRQVFYEKRADASGRPSLREFAYSEKSAPAPEDIPNPMEDIEARLDEFNRRLEKLETARRPRREPVNDD